MSDTDLELLARYIRHHAEDAFAEIVRCHLGLVYSAALRQVRSPQLAEEVAQSVFTSLAREAGRLRPDTILTAWLYQVTHHTAANVVRGEVRRQMREQIATELNAMNATAADWTHIEPLLDDAMLALDQTDRAAVLLRYFENKSLREVGAALGASENAAQKRLARAVERLREFFATRGVTVGASGLVLVISANAVQAAPVGLVVTISTAAAAFAGTGLAATVTATTTATQAIAMTTLQKTLVTVVVATSLAAPFWVHHRAQARLREQGKILRLGAEQLAKLRTENDALSRLVAPVNGPQPLPNEQFNEVLRLRGELGRLQVALRELTGPRTNEPLSRKEVLVSMRQLHLDRANGLKQLFAVNPAETIPELQYLTEGDWLDFVIYDHRKIDPGSNSRLTSRARSRAQVHFALNVLEGALRQFGSDNQGQFPTDLSQLTPYFKSPVDASALQGWAIVPANSFSGRMRMDGDWAITQKALVNAEMDKRVVVGMHGHAVD